MPPKRLHGKGLQTSVLLAHLTIGREHFGVPHCTTCSQEIPATSAFCSHCGSPNPEAIDGTTSSDVEVLQRRLQAALGEAFTVEHPLGEGGFAKVFAVFDRK